MLTGDQLTSIRRTVEQSLPDRCTIRRATSASDSVGGWADTYADHQTGVPCRLATLQRVAGEQVAAGQLDATGDWQLTLPAGTDVTTDDQVRVDTQGGVVFEVMQVSDPRSQSSEVVVAMRTL